MSNFDNELTDAGSKVQPYDAASHRLTACKGIPYKEKLFAILDGMQFYNIFAVRVNGTLLFMVIKYTRLRPR